MTRSPPKDPLIAVVGATGTGKSQLAVELAKRFDGEIINGDAMQLYAGLPIITNKITAEEQQGIPHHLLGCIGLYEQTWVVGTFVKKAVQVIEEIRSRGKLPILVGGTHYYTQSLLFNDQLSENDKQDEEKMQTEDMKAKWPILGESTKVLLEELRSIDPVMADRWHPNDHRKIQRSLEIYLQTGIKASDRYAEQRKNMDTCTDAKVLNGESVFLGGSALRFPTLLFWVHAETDALRERLNARVDNMLKHGLLNEVETLNANAQAQAVDETRGIWVSIGYKEFKTYVNELGAGQSNGDRLEQLKAAALERTKIATHQYAKRQIRWIRIKLLNALSQAQAKENIYLLDGSDASSFHLDVVDPALNLTHAFLTASSPMPEPASLSKIAAEMLMPKRGYDLAATPENWTRHHCELCEVTCVTGDQWAMHVKSKAHRKLLSKQKKLESQSRTGDRAVESSVTGDLP